MFVCLCYSLVVFCTIVNKYQTIIIFTALANLLLITLVIELKVIR